MRMTVHSVNGKAVAHTTFTTSFRQTAPAVIRDVWNVAKVKYVRIRTTETEHILDDEDVRAIESEAVSKGLTDDYDLDAQISALNDLKSQARELRDLIYDKEDDIMDHLVYADEEDTTSLGQCKDLACAFKSLAHEIRHAHGQLCDNASGWRAFFGCAHGKVFVEDAVDALEDEDEDWTEVYIEDMDWETDTTFFEDDDAVYDDDFGSNSYISDHYRSSVCSMPTERRRRSQDANPLFYRHACPSSCYSPKQPSSLAAPSSSSPPPSAAASPSVVNITTSGSCYLSMRSAIPTFPQNLQTRRRFLQS